MHTCSAIKVCYSLVISTIRYAGTAKGMGSLRRNLPIALTLRTADAMRLQDLKGGSGARVVSLTLLGVQMVKCFNCGTDGGLSHQAGRAIQV